MTISRHVHKATMARKDAKIGKHRMHEFWHGNLLKKVTWKTEKEKEGRRRLRGREVNGLAQKLSNGGFLISAVALSSFNVRELIIM